MTTQRIARNQHWCDRCMLFFSSRYNLGRHKRRNNPCAFNDNSTTPRKVIDALTGELRYRTPYEQCELERERKFKNYWDIQSTERIRALHQERYWAFGRKRKKTSTNPKGRRNADEESSSVRNRRRHWASVLREAKQRWSENMIQEQARLLAAYHHVGSARAPRWVKVEVYTYMARKYRRSGLWVPERGIFWEVNSATEDTSETSETNASNEPNESTDRSDSDELEDR